MQKRGKKPPHDGDEQGRATLNGTTGKASGPLEDFQNGTSQAVGGWDQVSHGG